MKITYSLFTAMIMLIFFTSCQKDIEATSNIGVKEPVSALAVQPSDVKEKILFNTAIR